MGTMTNKTKFYLSLILALSVLLRQVEGVFAAPHFEGQAPVSGMIQSITLENDTVTGVTLVSIDIIDANQNLQAVRVSLETAIEQGFVVLNGDGRPGINNAVLGKPIELDPTSIIPKRQETQHPVGSALATFFSDISGMDYETIMAAHQQGVGFGIIAQALWLTTKLGGNADVFEALINAKQTGDFSEFILEDGSTPENWGQLRKAVLDKHLNNSVGVIMSNQDNNGNGNGQGNGNNGNGSQNSHGSGNDNGHGNNNNNNRDNDKDNGRNNR
jgi:hypothetical protein